MELVIKIPDEVYQRLLEEQHLPNRIDLEYFIVHGTPLPNVFQEIKNDMIDRSFMSDIYNDETEEEIIHLNEAFDAMDKYIRDKE